MEWHCSDQRTTYLNSTPTETQAHTNIANKSTTLCFSNFLTLSPTPASWTFFSATALLSWTSSCWIYIWSPGLYIHTRKKSLVWFILNRANPRTQNAKEYLPNISCMCVPPTRLRRGPRNPSRCLLPAPTVDRRRVLQWPLPVRHWGALPVRAEEALDRLEFLLLTLAISFCRLT